MHKFYKAIDFLFSNFLKIACAVTLTLLMLIIFFISKESILFFKEYSFIKFVTSNDWSPLRKVPSFGILSMICSTLYVSLVALCIALPLGIGTSLITSCVVKKKFHKYILPIFNLLAGIPSVIYGFWGLLVIVKFFEAKLNFSTGESIFVGGVVLAMMILPYIISTCHESMIKIKANHEESSSALGIHKWYMMKNLILPSAKISIFSSSILALSRAIGETMAVMMVIGNSPIMPKLFSRGETLSGLIALEMGGAEIGSAHYHALYAAGFVLIIMLLLINLFFAIAKKFIEKRYL